MKYRKYMAVLFLALSLILMAIGCGNKEGEKTSSDTGQSNQDAKAQIQASMDEMIDRLKEGDKTVLYESEFTYYRDEVPLSDYMELYRVKNYPYDSLSHVVIDSIDLMDDSALVYLRLFYNTPNAELQGHPYSTKFYYSEGRWTKPYMSLWPNEVEYQERIKAYQEAVKQEESDDEGQ